MDTGFAPAVSKESCTSWPMIDIDVPAARKGDETVFFIANRLEGNKLIGRWPGRMDPGTYEITVSPDFNDWELYFNTQHANGRKTFTRK